MELGACSAVEGVAVRAVLVGLLLRERRVEQAVPAVAVRGVMFLAVMPVAARVVRVPMGKMVRMAPMAPHPLFLHLRGRFSLLCRPRLVNQVAMGAVEGAISVLAASLPVTVAALAAPPVETAVEVVIRAKAVGEEAALLLFTFMLIMGGSSWIVILGALLGAVGAAVALVLMDKQVAPQVTVVSMAVQAIPVNEEDVVEAIAVREVRVAGEGLADGVGMAARVMLD